jgi:hypothetical protein
MQAVITDFDLRFYGPELDRKERNGRMTKEK